MKKITADFVRQEVARLGALVVETALYHPSGMKLFSAGDAITLAHAKALHASALSDLYLLEFDEDVHLMRKLLGIQRVAPAEVVSGDVLMEDLRGADGELTLASGTTIIAGTLDHVHRAVLTEIAIRDRRLAESMRQAQEYFAQLGEPERKKGMSTRVTRVTHTASTSARYLLIPRSKVLVAVTDDPLRIFLVNALQSEGHEVVDRPGIADAVELARCERPNLALFDLEECETILNQLRSDKEVRELAILVCAREGKAAKAHVALASGANDTLPYPPSRDVLNEKLQGCQALLGRKVRMTPALRSDRRRRDRREGKGDCTLRDPTLSRPLSVVSGEILDLGEGGVRIDYNLPNWPCPWAYMVHGVHPRHPFYAYAASNPLGRDLLVSIPGPSGTPVEKAARVAQVSPDGELETLGLIFPDGQTGTKSTAIRKKF